MQLRIARRVVKDGLSLTQARRMIEDFAGEKGITQGRGLERKPSDDLRNLKSGLSRLVPHVQSIVRRSQAQVDEMFAFIGTDRHREIVGELDDTIASLVALRAKVHGASGVGSKRGGGEGVRL